MPKKKKLNIMWGIFAIFIIIILVLSILLIKGCVPDKDLNGDGNGNGAGGGAGANGDGISPVIPDETIYTCSELCVRLNYDLGYQASELQADCRSYEHKVYSYERMCCCYNTADVPSTFCNDADNTEGDFEASLESSSYCEDDYGKHYDSCDVDGLLEEWYCTEQADECKHTFYNCNNMLNSGFMYECAGGKCNKILG